MKSATPALRRAIRGGHTVATHATVLTPDDEQSIPLLGGSVTLDRNATSRASAGIEVPIEYVPRDSGSLLSVHGNEVVLSRGVRFPDGDELIQLGTFRIEEWEATDSGEDASLSVELVDRSAWIIEASFEEPHQVLSGTPVADAIRDAIRPAYPQVVFDFAEPDVTLPGLLEDAGGDRWEFARTCAMAGGCELFFDEIGHLVLRPIPTGVGEPIVEISEGESGVLLNVSNSGTRDGAANRWYVEGDDDGSGTIPIGVATDDGMLSPTRYGPRFGRIPDRWTSTYITTQPQAQTVANNRKRLNMGTIRRVSFGSLVNPALEPDDIVRIKRERIGVDEDHILDSLTIPLEAEGEMSGTTRELRVA